MGFFCSFVSWLPHSFSSPLLWPRPSPLQGCAVPFLRLTNSASVVQFHFSGREMGPPNIGVSCALLVQLWPGEVMARDMWLSSWGCGPWRSLRRKYEQQNTVILITRTTGNRESQERWSGSPSHSSRGRGRIQTLSLPSSKARIDYGNHRTNMVPDLKTSLSWWDQGATVTIETHKFQQKTIPTRREQKT